MVALELRAIHRRARLASATGTKTGRGVNRAAASSLIVLSLAVTLISGGCGVSKGDIRTLETQNRILSEQNNAQQAEIANLHQHRRKLEDQLIRIRRELADIPDGLERR